MMKCMLWFACLMASYSMAACHAHEAPAHTLAQPISVDHIRFKNSSVLAVPASLDHEFVRSLEPEELIWPFLRQAGIPIDLTYRRRFKNSWEDPMRTNLAGEFTGHYLKAAGQFVQNTGDMQLLDKASRVVSDLAEAQQSNHNGYLYAYPSYHFDLLHTQAATHSMANITQDWGWYVPLYVVDKIIGGLVDFYRYTGQKLALAMALKNVDEWLIPYVERFDDDAMQRALHIEFGALQETLFHLFEITGDQKHSWAANRFTKHDFFNPMVEGHDVLQGLHANTHLAQVTGYVACYEATGNATCRDAVLNFLNILTTNHTWTSGGSNSEENWGAPMRLGDFMNDIQSRMTQETCTSHNAAKILQAAFTWTTDPGYIDAMERLLYNGVLGTQRIPPELQQSHRNNVTSNSLNDSIRIEFINAGFDRTAKADECTPPEKIGEFIDTGEFTWWSSPTNKKPIRNDVIKPGPFVRTYFTPMGAGQSRADADKSWGRSHKTYCCHGTGIESTALLPEHIAFVRQPQHLFDVPTFYLTMFDNVIFEGSKLGIGIDIDIDSTILWTSAPAWLVKISFLSVDHNSTLPSTMIRMALRMPAWTTTDATVDVRISGASIPTCDSNQPGNFCFILNNFTAGDTIQMFLPMASFTETLKDDRAEYQTYKSIIMGPFVLAGITHDTRRIAIRDGASNISEFLSPANATGLASIMSLPQLGVYDQMNPCNEEQIDGVCLPEDITTYAMDGLGHFLKMNHGKLDATPDISNTADGMDASFRIIAAYRRGNVIEALPFGTYPLNSTISLESMTMPGHFIGADEMGNAVLHRDDGNPNFEATHSFFVRKGNDGRSMMSGGIVSSTISFELKSSSNKFLTILKPGTVKITTLDSLLEIFEIGFADALAATSLWVREPLGRYHEGSYVLRGDDRSYVVAPFHKIVEERYTVFFEVQDIE